MKYRSTNKFGKNVRNISSKAITPLLSIKHMKFSVGRRNDKKIPRNNVIEIVEDFSTKDKWSGLLSIPQTLFATEKAAFMWTCRIIYILIAFFMLSRLGNVNTNLILINFSQRHKIFFLSCYTYWNIHWPCFCFRLCWL